MSNYPSWDEYFLNIARVVSTRSKDKYRQVGSVLINEDKHIISTGYNGFLPGYPDETIDWDNREYVRNNIIHAELNTILHCHINTKNTIMYSTLSPCSNCLKHLAAAGVKKIVFLDEYRDFNEVKQLAESYHLLLIRHPSSQTT